jgi:hypothetical protein
MAADRYDDKHTWDPDVPPEEDGLDLMGRSMNAETVKHEEELARLAVSTPS